MSSFPVCRVCLAFDIKMYALDPQFATIFEKLTNYKIHPKDGKPNTVCYICSSLLKRCLLFTNMSRIADGILSRVLLTNPKLTRELVTLHTEGIVNTFYATPVLICSIPPDEASDNITNEFAHETIEPITQSLPIKTEELDDEHMVVVMSEENLKEQSDQVVKNEHVENENEMELMSNVAQNTIEEVSDNEEFIYVGKQMEINEHVESENEMELMSNVTQNTIEESDNEQLIYIGKQMEVDEEVDLEQIVSRIAQNIENEEAVFGKAQTSEAETSEAHTSEAETSESLISEAETSEAQTSEAENVVVKQEKDDLQITEEIPKTDHESKVAVDDSTNSILVNRNKHKMDLLISALTQELEEGINAIENEGLNVDVKKEIYEGSSDDCIVILSDDDDKSESNQTILIDDDDDVNTIAKKPPQVKACTKKSSNKKSTYFACSQCSKFFNTQAILKRHMKSHLNEQKKQNSIALGNLGKYKCNLCSDTFSFKFYFERHLCLHTAQNILICDLCGMTFEEKVHLIQHLESGLHE